MDFLTPFITPIVESLLVPVKRHLGFLVSSSKNVREMHAEVSKLDDAAQDVRTMQESNQVDRREVPHRVPGWLADVDKIKERAERIRNDGFGCFNIKAKYKAGKISSNIIKDVNLLMKENNDMKWTDKIIPLGRSSTSKIVDKDDQNQNNKNKIKSRTLIFNDVLKHLEPNNIKTQKMALCGMAGVGKTTMMEDLMKAAKDKKMFDYIVKVVVGQNPNLVVLQDDVANYLGNPLTEKTRDTRAASLEKRFENILKAGEKKILLILDDVWDAFNLKDIGLTSPLPNSIKMLLTSREEFACIQMGVEASSIFKINILKEPEDKNLFWETIGVSDIEHDVHKIGEDIIKRCGGLPIAIITIASTLKCNKKRHAWKNALSCIQNQDFSSFHIKERDNLVLIKIFEYSYENLNKDDLKAIFLLSGLFPDDYNIPIENLVRYGWGLKFFKNVHDIETARCRVNTYVDELIGSNLLIRGDREGCVKMHDLVRDFVLSGFSKVKQASIISYDHNACEQLKEDESYERILIKFDGASEFMLDFNQPSLTFLMLMNGLKKLKLPENFYTRMEKLEVVAYENMYRPLLPRYLTNLRALSLRGCSSVNEDISFLGDLINLEVLNLAYCRIEMLPSSIGKLKRLKLLDLTGCGDLCIADGVFRNLVKLEELYMKASYNMRIKFTDANYDELKILSKKLSTLEVDFFENKAQLKHMSFEKLKRFKISMGCLLPYIWSTEHYFENTLNLVISRRELLECKFNELFEETEILELEVDDINHLEDILVHPSQNSFSHLKKLHISNCPSLTFLFTISVAKGLRNLEILKISACPVLKSVLYGENSEIGIIRFQKLKILTLDNLQMLVSLCDPIIVIELPQLVELDLKNLHNVTDIFPDNNIDIFAKQPFLNKQVVIPKLKELKISSMENLRKIWPCEITSEEEVCNISTLTVTNCDNVNLFPSNPMRLLSHLKSLTIKNCGSIEVVFNIDFDKIEQLSNCSSLEYIHLQSLEKLSDVWSIKYAENNGSGFFIRGFQALKYLYILDCGRFRNIVTPTTINFDMPALKNITIKNYTRYDEEEPKEVGAFMSIVPSLSADNTLNFHQLREVDFEKFQRVEVLFEIESPIKRDQLVTTQQPLVLLPYLESLKLASMDNLTHVWKCSNWNDFFILHKHQPQSSSFQNLTSISLHFCPNIKYLFSPLMVKLLSNLKEVKIKSCYGMEEVVSNQDGEHEEITHTATTNLFPHLHLLELYLLEKLKHIDGGVAAKGTTNVSDGQSKLSNVGVVSWSLCQYSKEIRIQYCDALSSVIPSCAAGQLQKLQVLSVKDCGSIREAFETKESNNLSSCSSSTTAIIDLGRHGTDTAVSITRLRNIIVHKLPNLKVLEINNCCCLEYICTFLTFESLKNLEDLTITDCEAVKVIVREESGEQTPMPSSKDMVFPHLKSIKLCHLQNLEGFFLGMSIDFQWPLLDYFMINDCPKMMAFTYGKSTAPELKYIHTELGKHDVEFFINFHVTPLLHQTTSHSTDVTSSKPIVSQGRTWSFHNLIQRNLDEYYKDTKIFPSNELQQLQKLETIHATRCRNVEEVFEVALEMTDNESLTVFKFPKLREVELGRLQSLKYIWKSNRWRKLEFPNLTRLSIFWCNSLEYVFTCSMVGCVKQLQELHIEFCKSMKVVVKGEEEEEDCDDKVSEIIEFPCLKSLKLGYLLCLEGFSLGKEDFTFPSLDTLEINYCSKISVFTKGRSNTPMLTDVVMNFKSCNVGEDINSLFKKQENQN